MSASAIAVRPALRHQRQHLALPRGQPGDRVAAAHHQLADHLGVEHGAAGRDPLQRGEEVVDVGDPVLEQVADPAPAAGEQVVGVGHLDVLRQHQHPRLRPLPAYLDRSPQPLVGVGRRHPDVHQARSGRCSSTAATKAGPSPTARRPRGPPRRGAAGAPRAAAPSRRRRRASCDLRPERGRAAGRRGDLEVAVDGAQPLASPARPCPLATWAPPRPSSLTVTTSRRPPAPRHLDAAAPLCLATLVSASATMK